MECFDKRNENGNRFWKLRISQKKSVINFVNKIGIKGKTDTDKIINLISKEIPYNTNQSFEKIRKIICKKGLYDVYDITTESSDFITNGLLVHNCGLSTLFSLYCLWKLNFRDAEDIDVVSLKQLKAQAFVAKMDSTLKYLPFFLKTKKTKDNEQVLQFENNSKIISESQSDNAGRSDTLSLLILDEAAHYKSEKMVRGIVASAQPTLSRTNGQFIILSTPNKTSGPGAYYYEQVVQARMGAEDNNKFISVDWWEVPDAAEVEGPKKGYNQVFERFVERDYYIKPEVRKEAKAFFDPIAETNWRDNPWLKKQHDDLGEILFKQEVLHSFIVGGNAVFNEDILKAVESRIKEPIEMGKLGSIRVDNMWIWKKPEPGHRYIVGCLPTGEKILTESGLKNIEEIKLEENLINKDGNKIKILNKQITHNFKNYIYDVKLEGALRRTKFTNNHPILSSINTKLCRKHGGKRFWNFDFKFNKVEKLNKDDWIIYPNMYKNNILSDDDILLRWPKNITRYDFEVKNPLLDAEFWWFIGIWLAEGWTQNKLYSKTIHTAHNLITEKKYAERIKILFEKYERKVCFTIKEKCNSIITNFCNVVLFAFLNENFGKYAKNKKIPEWIKYLPEEFKLKIVEGYLNGDGNISINEIRNNYYFEFVSISFTLLEDIQDILYSLGIISVLNVLREEGITKFPNGKISKTQKTYYLRINHNYSLKLLKKLKYNITAEDKKLRSSIAHSFFSDDLNYIYFKIQDITKIYYEGNVYNFETEDHTFLCKNITTHNCDIATGTGVETSSLEVLDAATYEQVCEYKGMIATKNFGKLVKNVASYYNQAYVVIECNGIGEAVFNEVYYHDTEPYYNLFMQSKTKNNMTRMTGWITDTKTRKLQTNEFIDWFSVEGLFEELKVYSKRLWMEMSTWIWDGSKPVHDSGTTDDAIMAFSLALYLRAKASNAGESFLINENGEFIEYVEGKDNLEQTQDAKKNFEFVDNVERDDSADDIFFQKHYGVSKSDYAWLIKG
jgi:intein/homing endonuclease